MACVLVFPPQKLNSKETLQLDTRGFNATLFSLNSLLKNTAQLKKGDISMKSGNEGKDVLGDSRKRYRFPWAEIGNYGPRKEQAGCRIRYRGL